MAILDFRGVGISALAAAVPARVVRNRSYQIGRYGAAAVAELVDKIGVEERRFAEPGVCASDLCFAAADKLLQDHGIDRATIDLLVCVTETPDQRMPGNAFLLHKRLQLGKHCICLDLPLCCAGFPYALSVVFSMMQSGQLRRALLLNGDTSSRMYSPNDRSTAFLFGDAGTAALVEHGSQYGESSFSLNTDGERAHYIEIPAGGARIPSSPETLVERVIDEYGNARTAEHALMLGGDVFNFVLSEVPQDVSRLLKHLDRALGDYQYIVFHQANSFINSYLARKLKLSPQQVLSSIAEFGNTSSASIPLTLVNSFQEKGRCTAAVLLSAFGVGMSWSTASLYLTNCHISHLVEI